MAFNPKAPQRAAIKNLLKAALKRKRVLRAGYSMRALARDLGLSSAYISNVFNGKKSLPKQRVAEIARLLELDIHERKRLFELIAKVNLPAHILKNLSGVRSAPNLLDDRRVMDVPDDNFLSKWYNVALLEGLSLDGHLKSVENLRTRLGLTQRQAQDAIQCLTTAGLIKSRGGEPVKREKHIYFPTGRSKKAIRALHEQMLIKAREQLISKTSDHDFHRRLITGFTFTVHPLDIERLKGKVLEFLAALSKEAGLAEGQDVYQCNVQFFPLTESID